MLSGWLDAHALEGAQCLAHALDFLFAGLLLTEGLTDTVAQFREAVDAFPEACLDRLDLNTQRCIHQGCLASIL